MQKDGRRGIKSVTNAFDIIEYLRDEPGRSLSEIAENVGLAPSTTHDYLSTLESLDVIENREGEFHLSYGLLEYGGYVKARNELYQCAKPELYRLAEKTGLTAYLGIEHDETLVRITSISPEEEFPIENRDGKREVWYSTALGKAILANLPEPTIDSILSKTEFVRLADNTITDEAELRNELEAVRKTGYAVNDAEHSSGWKGIAAPIVVNGVIRGAISISGPKTILDDSEHDEVRMLKVAADKITGKLCKR